MASGCYEKRVSSKREAVGAEESYSRSLSAEKNQLASQKRLTSKQKSQAQGKLAALQARNNQLEARLQHMDTDTSAAKAEKERLSMQLAQSKKDAAVLNRKIESDAISERDLKREVDIMTKQRDDVANDIANSQVLQ